MPNLSETDLLKRIKNLERDVYPDSASTPDSLTGISGASGVDVGAAGGTVLSGASEVTFLSSGGASLSVTDDGDGTATVTVDGGVGVADSGGTVLGAASEVTFAGSPVSATDDGDGTATVSVTSHRMVPVALTDMANGDEAVGLRTLVPSGKTLEILEVGVMDDTGATPAGLTIDVYDNTNAVSLVSKNAAYHEFSTPVSAAGAIDVEMKVTNGTGGQLFASGFVLFRLV